MADFVHKELGGEDLPAHMKVAEHVHTAGDMGSVVEVIDTCRYGWEHYPKGYARIEHGEDFATMPDKPEQPSRDTPDDPRFANER